MTAADTRECPAVVISAPASGQGKTTVTAALARYHRWQGRRVRVFKVGPDFIDPMILTRASGQTVWQLDLWMGGDSHCQQLLYQAAGEAELILIEGVMGLFDGDPSTADIAERFNIPVLNVIDANAMAQTFGAVAYGLTQYRCALKSFGVVGNGVASAGHAAMLAESLSPGLRYLGSLPRNVDWQLPDRHLGLLQAQEIGDLDARLDAVAIAIEGSALTELPPPVAFHRAEQPVLDKRLDSIRIGVASDNAFSFVYAANIAMLQQLGAELVYFSPLQDEVPADVHSYYFPGGYPELHAAILHSSTRLKAALHAHHEAGKPIVAECGGMLYLLDALTDAANVRYSMVGLLPGTARMQDKLANLGLHSVALPEGRLRGHTFHYSRLASTSETMTHSEPVHRYGHGEAVFRVRRLHASYMHLYFPSNLAAAAALFAP